jgi:2-dehydro-3-deoxygluconokinase
MEVHYGGSESNVMCLLGQLNHPVSFFTALPDSALGMAAAASLQACKVNTDRIVYTSGRMGIYFLEKGAGPRASKVLYDRAHSAMAEIDTTSVDWEALLDGVTHLHWSGITPALSEKAYQFTKALLLHASQRPVIISADLNFRSNLWKYGRTPVSCMPELIDYCEVLLGGNDDSLKMLGLEVPVCGDELSIEEEALLVAKRCAIWSERFPKLKHIASTLRRSLSASRNLLAGAYWNSSGFYLSRQYDIDPIADRVGGGDAFMGGFLHGLMRHPKDGQRIIETATAASVLKHSMEGDVAFITEEELNRFVSSHHSIRIQR